MGNIKVKSETKLKKEFETKMHANIKLFALAIIMAVSLPKTALAMICMNGGTPNPNVDGQPSSCTCLGAYFGNRCQAIKDCSTQDNKNEPNYCAAYADYCSFKMIRTQCPMTCKRCLQGSDFCKPKNCMNGGVWNSVFCTCLCPTSYVGPQCELLDCVRDDFQCMIRSKSICKTNFKTKCPNLCGMCTVGLSKPTKSPPAVGPNPNAGGAVVPNPNAGGAVGPNPNAGPNAGDQIVGEAIDEAIDAAIVEAVDEALNETADAAGDVNGNAVGEEGGSDVVIVE